MNAAPLSQLLEIIHDRRDVIADTWYKAIAGTNFTPFTAAEVRRQLASLIERALVTLLEEPFERQKAQAIGATLARLHYIHPEALGRTQEVLARQLVEGLSPDHAAALQPRLAALLGAMAAGFYRQARTMILDEQEEIRGALFVARRQAEAVLQASEERFRSAFNYAAVGMALNAIDGHWLQVNRSLCEIVGYSEQELLATTWQTITHPGDLEAELAYVHGLLAGELSFYHLEKRFVHKLGHVVWVLVSVSLVRDAEGKPLHFIAQLQDITERKRVEAQLTHAALHDALTGLPNRALFLDRLEHAAGRAKRDTEQLYAVLFLDLDRFKTINDSLGHSLGDYLLIEIARRLERCLRPGDTVARLGGDEFAILLEDLHDVGDATRVADRVLVELRTPFNLRGHEVFTSGSIGIVVNASGDEQPEEILRDADIAMYQAKARGKARYEVFDLTMHAHIRARLQLEIDLRRAIEQGELQVHYMPIVLLASGEIIGVEALVRWQAPNRELVFPDAFIALAEETGLIVPLSDWVLCTACMQAKAWHDAGLPPVAVAVNLSASQFARASVTSTVAQALHETGLASVYLKLELTESSIMEHPVAIIAELQELEKLGIELSIDDFGTGYSALSYLKNLPITTVKLAQSFVHNITTNPRDAALATAIIAMAHSLDYTVIAEGVETVEQLEFLRAQQCDAAQGYLFSAAVPVATLTRLLEEGGQFPMPEPEASIVEAV